MTGRHLATAIVGVSLSAAAAWGAEVVAPTRPPSSINARQERQAARLAAGREDGGITRGESHRIRRDEASIRAKERFYRNTDPGLSRWERRDLETDLNYTSREIYRARQHNRLP